MSHRDWRRHPDGDVAVDELLDAAGHAFAELGVAKATMVDVGRYAGCSRATLYRYFDSRSALHLAYVNRAALQIAGTLGDLPRRRGDGTAEILTDRLLAGIDGVRSDPLLAVWFEPENMAVPVALSQDSEVLSAMASGFIDGLDDLAFTAAEVELRGAWLLRCIVALLAMPADRPTERAMVETFLVPVLIDATPAGPDASGPAESGPEESMSTTTSKGDER